MAPGNFPGVFLMAPQFIELSSQHGMADAVKPDIPYARKGPFKREEITRTSRIKGNLTQMPDTLCRPCAEDRLEIISRSLLIQFR